MKKQRIVIIFTAVLLMFQIFALSGCASDETLKDEDAQVVYYINNAGTGVEAQAYDIISTETGAQIEELVWRLGAIPDKLEYKAPLQMGFSLLSYRVEGETLYLDVSEEYRNLKPTTEVLVRAALVRTFS